MADVSHLDCAIRAEAWIDSTRIETGAGLTWPVLAEKPDGVSVSLYQGVAGILLYYLELFETTGNEAFLECAGRGADDLIERIRDSRELTAGLYQGLSGLAFTLAEVAERTARETHRAAAVACLERLQAAAVECGEGIGWIEPIPFAEAFGVGGDTEVWDVSRGSAGVGLGLLDAHRRKLHPQALDLAKRIGDRLVQVAATIEEGLQWQMMSKNVGWTAPGFSHGTAGISYFLARLFEETRESSFLDAALGGAAHLQAIATPTGHGHLIYHSETSKDRLYYLAWCHGPPGTARLFHQLDRVTDDGDWADWLIASGDGLLATGAPEERTRGFWNNISQCCGDAAVGELALSLYEITSAPRFLKLAERVGSSLQERSHQSSRGLCWIQAEHRTRPDFLQAQTGYMQGAAGVGSYLLRLDAVAKGKEPRKIHFPDSTFGESS